MRTKFAATMNRTVLDGIAVFGIYMGVNAAVLYGITQALRHTL